MALRFLFLHFSKHSFFQCSITETLYSLTYCASRQAKLLISHQTTRTHIATSAVYRLLSLVACYHLHEDATLFDSFAASWSSSRKRKPFHLAQTQESLRFGRHACAKLGDWPDLAPVLNSCKAGIPRWYCFWGENPRHECGGYRGQYCTSAAVRLGRIITLDQLKNC